MCVTTSPTVHRPYSQQLLDQYRSDAPFLMGQGEFMTHGTVLPWYSQSSDTEI